jgi:hypothetical protein
MLTSFRGGVTQDPPLAPWGGYCSIVLRRYENLHITLLHRRDMIYPHIVSNTAGRYGKVSSHYIAGPPNQRFLYIRRYTVYVVGQSHYEPRQFSRPSQFVWW